MSVILPKVGSVGLIIFSTEPVRSSKPTTIISISTMKPVTYSSLPCPSGCSLSFGFDAIRKPISAIIDEPASEILLNASAIMETEPEIKPSVSFPAKSKTLHSIPTIPARAEYAPLTRGFAVSVPFFMKIFVKRSVIEAYFSFLSL